MEPTKNKTMPEDQQLDSMYVSDIFTEFANVTRCNLLLYLHDVPSTAPDLVEEFTLPVQEVHRQLNRLQEIKLIEKQSDGKFTLTSIGQLAISNISFFNVLDTYKDYFTDHHFGDLPDYLIQQIGALENAEFRRGIGNSIESYKQIVNESYSKLQVLLPQIVVDANENVLKNAKNGMKVQYLYGKNTIVPSENEKIENKYGIKKMITDGTVQRKLVEHIYCTVVITDKHAMLFLPDKSNESDINYFFIGDDEYFRQWCMDVFYYYWNKGDKYEES